jgi:hypothetical protein
MVYHLHDLNRFFDLCDGPNLDTSEKAHLEQFGVLRYEENPAISMRLAFVVL